MSKRGFADGYKTYDPHVEGFGSPHQWRSAFSARMGVDEAKEVFTGKKYGPWAVLGIPEGSPWKLVKSTFRALSMACHPDRCILNKMTKEEAEEKFKILTAAYTELCPD